jgi:DNA-binding transcriptional MerR regulator
MEYRIEQLAQVGGVAVDTIRFYQGKGLLDPPRRDGRVTWYSAAHLDRLRRIRDLQQRGFTLTVIRRFLEGELEPSDEALVEAVTSPSPPETLSLDELASRSGVAPPLLKALEQAGLLFPTADGDEPRYPAEDLEVLAAGLKLVEAGVPLPALMELGGQHAAAVEATARRAVELFDRHVRERIQAEGRDPEAAERELLRLFEELLEASGTLVRHHFQRTLLRAAREHIERSRR